MSTVTPPPPPTIQAGPLPSPVLVVRAPPPALLSLPPGTVFEAVVAQTGSGKVIQVDSQFGTLSLRSPLIIPQEATLRLIVDQTTPRPLLHLTAIDDKPVSPRLLSQFLPSARPPQAPPPPLTYDPSLSIRATVLRPIAVSPGSMTALPMGPLPDAAVSPGLGVAQATSLPSAATQSGHVTATATVSTSIPGTPTLSTGSVNTVTQTGTTPTATTPTMTASTTATQATVTQTTVTPPTTTQTTAQTTTPLQTPTSQTATPRASTPQQATTSQTLTPQTATPQTAAPQATIPQTAAPQATTPQTTTPQTATPQTATPQTATPQATTPQTATPRTATPQTTTPQATTAQTTTAVSTPPPGGRAASAAAPAAPATPSTPIVPARADIPDGAPTHRGTLPVGGAHTPTPPATAATRATPGTPAHSPPDPALSPATNRQGSTAAGPAARSGGTAAGRPAAPASGGAVVSASATAPVTIPAGSDLSLRITAINQPGQPAAEQSTGPDKGLLGTAMGRSGNDHLLVQTSTKGLLSLETSLDPPKGSRLRMELDSLPMPVAKARVQAMLRRHHLITHWPSLKESLAQLSSSDPIVFQKLLETAMPRPDAPLGPRLLFFLAALRLGDLRAWVGGEALRVLGERKPELSERLGEDFRILGRTQATTPQGDWRVYSAPIYDGGALSQIRLLVRDHPDEGGDDDPEQERDKNRRFIVEVTLSRLGRLQLDGLVGIKKGRFDLILRSERALDSETRDTIRALFKQSAEIAGLKGGVTFRYGPHFVTVPESMIVARDDNFFA